MRLNIRRGIKFGAMSAVFLPIVLPINDNLRGDHTSWDKVLIGTLFAFVIFSIIGSVTDKIGSDVGEV